MRNTAGNASPTVPPVSSVWTDAPDALAGLVAGEPTVRLLGRLLREAAAVCGAHVDLMFLRNCPWRRPSAARRH